MRRVSKNSVAFVCLVVSISCVLVLMASVLRLPEVSVRNNLISSIRPEEIRHVLHNAEIGKFGEMMIDMLPDDLAFTIFIPSIKAFERDLRLRMNDSLGAEKINDTYAILTRVLGFSVVPRMISSLTIPYGKEITYDSLSGFNLYILKDVNGILIVNGVRTKQVDLSKGKIIVHIMDGVIMDVEFQQSVQPDYND